MRTFYSAAALEGACPLRDGQPARERAVDARGESGAVALGDAGELLGPGLLCDEEEPGMARAARAGEERLRLGASSEPERGLGPDRGRLLVARAGAEELLRARERVVEAPRVRGADRLVAKRVPRRVGGAGQRCEERAAEEGPPERREGREERRAWALGEARRERRVEAAERREAFPKVAPAE